MTKKVFIVGGGTGGHIIPARCVAKELIKSDYEVAFFGDAKISNYIKKDDGFKSRIIMASQLKTSPKISLLKAAILIGIGFLQSIFWILLFRPKFIIAFGGYSSFPMLAAAVLLKKKFILHEQNAHFGKVNRLFARFAHKIALTFPDTSGMKNDWQNKSSLTGLPLRPEIAALNQITYEPNIIDFELASKSDKTSANAPQISSNLRLVDEEFEAFFDDYFEGEEPDERQRQQIQSLIAKKNFTKILKKTGAKGLENSDIFRFKSQNLANQISQSELDGITFLASTDDENFLPNTKNYQTFEELKNSLPNQQNQDHQKKMGYDVVLASDFSTNHSLASSNKNSKTNSTKTYFEVLVIGGSGGAKIFSDILPKAFFNLSETIKNQLSITQQCRANLVDSTMKQYQEFSLKSEISAFFEDMPSRITKADLVIARSGASSIFEFCAAKKPMILVPFADSADDHQAKNAQYLAKNEAAILLPEKDFTISNLSKILHNLIANPSLLKKISENSSILSNLSASANIIKLIDDRKS